MFATNPFQALAGQEALAATHGALAVLAGFCDWRTIAIGTALPSCSAATNAAAKVAADLTKAGALVSVAGGGDTVAALNQAGAAADFTFISTAGGAFLEWMEGKELPGVAALMA